MAVSSPALALGDTTPQEFAFEHRVTILAQVRFYTSTDGAPGTEIAPSAGGTRTVTISTITRAVATYPVSVDDPSREYEVTEVVSDIDGASKVCDGGTWHEFSFGPGLANCRVSASGGADPVGAMSYRIWLDVSVNRSEG